MPKNLATEGLRKPAAATTPLVHLQVPPGMDAALRGLTREVLRRQPSDLYLFAHRYFESLLAERVAQQAGDEVTDAESLFSKKQSMRDIFHEEESKKEIVHRIHLEDDGSSGKNVVHNINIEVEGDDASIEETKVKVEITGDEGKKRKKSRDRTSFEEEITTTRTEHVTVCKSWKVETRVETSESGEIRVESFTDASKTKQSSKPRKFASEEGKKSRSSIEEEKRAAKAKREKAKKESSKSKSFENVDKNTSRELILLERHAAAHRLKSDDGKMYQSFIQLDDDESAANQSKRFIEIEHEEALTRSRRDDESAENQLERFIETEQEDVLTRSKRDDDASAANQLERFTEIEQEDELTRSRRDVGDSTREVSPDDSVQSPQVALQKMEESLIQLKESETRNESLKKSEDVSHVSSQVADDKLHRLKSPEDALIQMERSLIELKETSLASAAETRTDEHVSNVLTYPEKSSLEEKELISTKSEEKPKSFHISEQKQKIIESVKEIVHEIEEKDMSHIRGEQKTEEKQYMGESKRLEEKHKIIENVKEVANEIERKASSVFSHVHGKEMTEEKETMSLKSEDDSISEKRHKIIEDVKQVLHEIEGKTSSVLTHFPEKTETSIEKTEGLDPNPDDKESIVVETHTAESQRVSPEPETSVKKAEGIDPNAKDKTNKSVEIQIGKANGSERKKAETSIEKTEVLGPITGDQESIVVEEHRGEETGPEPERTENSIEKTKRLEEDSRKDNVADELDKETDPKPEYTETSAEKTEFLDEHVRKDNGADVLGKETDPKPQKTETSAEKTEVLKEDDSKDNVLDTETDPKPESTDSLAEKTEVLEEDYKKNELLDVPEQEKGSEPEKTDHNLDERSEVSNMDKDVTDSIVIEAEATKQTPKPDDMEASAEKTEDLNLIDKGSIVVEERMKEGEATEDTEKRSREPELKTVDESGEKREKANESEMKGRPERDVEGSKLIETTEDKAANDKKREPDISESKEKSTERELTQPSKEEKHTSLQSKDKDKSGEQEKEAPVEEPVGKDRVKRSAEFLKTGEQDDVTEIQPEKEGAKSKDAEESLGEEQPQKRITDKLKEESDKENKIEEELNSQSAGSENKAAIEATGERSEAKNVDVEDSQRSAVAGGDSFDKQEILEDAASNEDNLEGSANQLDEKVEAQIKKDIEETKTSAEKETIEAALIETTAGKEAPVSASQESTEKKTPEAESSGLPVEYDVTRDKTPREIVEEQDIQTETAPGEPPSDKDTSQAARIRRSTEETFTKTEEVSERVSTSIMTHTILLGGPKGEVKSTETEIKKHQEEKSEMKTQVIKREVVDIEDVFGYKTYPIEEVDTLLDAMETQECHEGAEVGGEDKIKESPEEINVPVAKPSDEVTEEGESAKMESREEEPPQRKLASLDEESSSVSEGTGDGFLPPIVVISRVADVVELTDGEAKIVSQMEKEGLTTEYDENAKVKTGYWSAEDANNFLAGESQHTYHTLRKPELVYSDLHEARPPGKPVTDQPEKLATEHEPEKLVLNEQQKPVSDKMDKGEEIEAPSTVFVVQEQEESSPDKTESPSQDSDSTKGPVQFSLAEGDDDGKEITDKDKPWLARAHTVEEIFEKETVGEVVPVAPTPPRRSSVPGQVNVMMEMSKATSRIGQSIMVLSGGEKHPVQRSDSDEYCISEDAIYIPLRLPGTEPDIVEESDDEPFRIDQPPPTFSYDSDEGEWGRALAEQVSKVPSLTTVIIERKVDDPSALGRVTITEITDEDEMAISKEHATESKGANVEELPKPVFEIGSPVSDRSTDLSELRTDAKHRPSLADISEENLESAEDNEGSMNVELHISLSDGDNLSQRSYGTDSERKWTEDLTSVAHKAKDAATGIIKNIFGSSPRKDRQSPVRSESSLFSEADTDGGKRKRSESRDDEPERVTEDKINVVQEESKPEESVDKPYSHSSAKQAVDTKSNEQFDQKGVQPKTDHTQKETSRDNDKIKRSLPESSDSTSLTSVSLPLPDASYNLANVTSSTSAVDTPGDSDLKDDIPSEKSKPRAVEAHRSKRSVELQEVAKDQSDQKNKTGGSGDAAGSATQNAAEDAKDEHKKEDTRASAKDQMEVGLAGQEPASEPKDSVTSLISETLDSVESLPSEVSKNLWSIEDVPLAENLNESDIQEDEKKGSRNIASHVQECEEGKGDLDEDSSKKETKVVDSVLGAIEFHMETEEDGLRDVTEKAKAKVKSGEEKVEGLAREAKQDVRHKLTRGEQVVKDSLEDVVNEGKKIKSEVEKELEDKSGAMKDSISTAEENIKSEVKDVRDEVKKSVENIEEDVEKISKDLEEKVEEEKAKVKETVQKGKSKLSEILDNVGETINDAKEKITSVFKEGEHRVESLEEKAIEKVDDFRMEVSENIQDTEDNVGKKVDKEKSGFSKFIGGVADTIGDVKEKVSDAVTHAKEDFTGMATKREKLLENEMTEIEKTIEEQVEKVDVGIQKKADKAEKSKSELVEAVERQVQKGRDKAKQMKVKGEEEFKELKDGIREKVDKTDEIIEEAVHNVADKMKENEMMEGHSENISEEGEKMADSMTEKELDQIQRSLENSIELDDDGIDRLEGTKEKVADKERIEKVSKTKDTVESDAKTTSTTRMVLDKRKSEDEKSDELETKKVLAKSAEVPGTAILVESEKDDSQTDSSGKYSGGTGPRRLKRHILKREVTLGDLPQSADAFPSEFVDETSTSFDRADTVIHLTLDESEGGSEAIHKEEVIVPIHVEDQEASPVPPGKDTKATETDLLEKETVSRGTEPEETTEQMAEALRSEVKDLEERLSRLKESTWSLSQAGPDSRKGQGKVHASKSNVDGTDDATERTVHVKKSISSAESMSFASRVLSTPMGSVKEEYSEMKKSMAETTHETILTVEKGVQSEGSEEGGNVKGESERRTTVTTATQVSVPSNEPSDDESRKSHFQRAKSMDAKTEARAITNFSKRNSKKTFEQTQKVDSSRAQLKQSEHAEE